MTVLLVAGFLSVMTVAVGVRAQTAGFAPADQQEFASRVAGRRIHGSTQGDTAFVDFSDDGSRLTDESGFTIGYTYFRTGPNVGTLTLPSNVIFALSGCAGETRMAITFSTRYRGTWVIPPPSTGPAGCSGQWYLGDGAGNPISDNTGPPVDDTSDDDTPVDDTPVDDTPAEIPPIAERELATEIVRTVVAATAANVTAGIKTRFSAARGGALTGRRPATEFGASSMALTPVPGAIAHDGDLFDDSGRETGSQGIGLAALLQFGTFEIPLDASGNATDDGVPGTGGTSQWTLWGLGDLQFFENDSDRRASYDGDLKAGYLGVDAQLGDRSLAGVAASVTRAEAGYGPNGSEDGGLEMTLAGVHPYFRHAPDERSEIWVLLGAGQGMIEHRTAGASTRDEGDLTMWMGSTGARRALAPAGALDLSLLGDLGFAHVETDEELRVLDRLTVDTWRARLGIEGSHSRVSENGSTTTSFLEVATRYDGGDGEDDYGLELSPGLYFSNPETGFGFEARGRILALHSADSYREYGASVTASRSPRAGGLGLSLSVSPRWGAHATGADTLWRDDALRPESTDAGREAVSLDARVGFGLRAMHGVLTPFGQVDLRDQGSRRARLGVYFDAADTDAGRFSLKLWGERYESARRFVDHRLRLTGRLDF